MTEIKGKIFRESLQLVVGERFGRYSKYIIQDRALPDVRDGLKPVQRRILYAMYHEGNTNSKPFRKSAKTVGNVIGNYHPHGDTSVYDAMVRLSQDWKMREPLVQMHGNNGSIDGDSAAAMRYTEARLSTISELLLENIDKDTVDFIPNFDDTYTEPTVLPARYPNLLVNGSMGISAGYATDIPPHNLKEVIEATIHLIKQPNANLDDIMQYMQGPDFPGGAIVQGVEGIRQAFETGKGKIVIRSKVEKEVNKGKVALVITEVPYEVNKANMVRQMDEIRVNKSIDGIAEVRDESDRMGLRIVVELKKDANVEAIENYLYKNTDLQVNYNYNMVAIYNGHPRLLGVKQILTAYIEHQLDVLARRTKFDLQKAKKRAHIVDGLIKALSILDEVIATIRQSKNRQDAIQNLVVKFEFTTEQAEAIVQLQLYRLTNTDVVALEQESAELQANIVSWQELLNDESKMRAQLVSELSTVISQIPSERRSVVEHEVQNIVIEAEALIAKRSGMVTITRDGYIKFSSMRSFNASNGEGHGQKETDALIAQYEVENTQTIIAITSGGSYLFIPVHTIPESKWKDTGVHLSTLSQYDTTEKIIYAFGIDQFIKEKEHLIIASQNGFIKKIDVGEMQLQRYSKATKVMGLKDDDVIIAAQKVSATTEKAILLITKEGFANFFSPVEVPLAGVKAQGVRSMKLSDDDVVATMFIGYDTDSVVLFTDRATHKRLALSQLEYTGRYKKGTRLIRVLKTQKYEIVGSAEFGTYVNIITSTGTIQYLLEKLPLADLQTVGKKIEEIDDIIQVYALEVATIETGAQVVAPQKTVADIDKTQQELERILEEQGVLFDD
jgi:DNA topoisomerase IV, A subunit, Gram-positive